MANNVTWNNEVEEKLFNDLGDKLELVGVFVESEAKKEITEMDAVKTGRLKNSIDHETDKQEFKTSIGTNVEYAPFVELGTSKMAPRPFLRNAIYKNLNEIKEILTRQV